MTRFYIVGDLRRTAYDAATLPAALLPLAKAQMRVRFADEDSYIQSLLLQAMAWVEANAELCLARQTWDWSFRRVSDAERWRYCADWWYGGEPLPLPKRPVQSFTMTDGSQQDVKPYWQETIQQDSTGIAETLIQRVDVAVSSWPLTIAMTCGYSAVADLPPLVQNAVLRYCAFLYENRESTQGVQFYEAPDFAKSVLGPLWVPRV